jgi:hypothetical protein
VLEQAEGEGNRFGLAAFLLALLKDQAKNLAVGHAAAGEVVDADATDGADLGRVRPLQRDTKIATITSSISAARPVRVASARIALEQSGSCSSGSSSIASASCRGGAD